MRQYGYSVMPSNMIKKLFSEFPVILLNLMLPGAAGAMASGYYAVARKIASVLQGIRIWKHDMKRRSGTRAPIGSEFHVGSSFQR